MPNTEKAIELAFEASKLVGWISLAHYHKLISDFEASMTFNHDVAQYFTWIIMLLEDKPVRAWGTNIDGIISSIKAHTEFLYDLVDLFRKEGREAAEAFKSERREETKETNRILQANLSQFRSKFEEL